MKKIIYAFYATTIFAFLIFLHACNKKENMNEYGKATYRYNEANSDIGFLHNLAMIRATDTSQFNFNNNSLFLNSIASFVDGFLMEQDSSLSDVSLAIEYSIYVSPSILRQKMTTLDSDWIALLHRNIIDSSELQVLKNLEKIIKKNLNDEISNIEFSDSIERIASENPATNFILANHVIRIAKASCEYWVIDGNLEPAADGAVHWVALDAAGVLVGATIQAVQGGDIVKGAVIGGVSASIRLVPTIGKGIAKWLGL